MNVFEDLIEELRDENLLEETVMDSSRVAADVQSATLTPAKTDNEGAIERNGTSKAQPNLETFVAEGPEDEREFYRKRAIDEVSGLQMVEHVVSAIEREHMKMMPASYDDLEAKKALHRFVQVQGDASSTEYMEAEFNLMRETEAWNTALSDRDQKISVSNLRRFCENCRPALSSQALIALSRFYRNAPYTELSRAKFDLIMTRLFSRDSGEGDEKRRLLFGRSEMIGHIKTLYANWSSVALYSAEDTELRARAVAAGFDDRVREAEAAENFEQLIQDSFFDKVHEFKEATGEMFFTPEIVAATIDCNVRIGNKFVDLVRVERQNSNLESIEQKYGYEYDQTISDAAGKTFQLVELVRGLPDSDVLTGDAANPQPESPRKQGPNTKREKVSRSPFKVNKWLLIATIIAVGVSTALYFWANQPNAETQSAEMAADVNLENTPFSEYLRTGRATPQTFYAVTLPSWDQLTEDQQKDILRQTLEFANKNGQKHVQLVNVRGRNVAYASSSRTEILSPAP